MERRIDASSFEAKEVQELGKMLEGKNLPALIDSQGNQTKLPKPIYQMLVDIIDQIKQGRAVLMLPEDETFTTQAAANFLGVSRQHLVDLLENDEIPFHYVGTHRRVELKDLKTYKDTRDENRRKSLDKLFQKVSEADKYDTSYTGDDS